MSGKAEPEWECEANGELVDSLEQTYAEECRRFIPSTNDKNPPAAPHFDMKSCRLLCIRDRTKTMQRGKKKKLDAEGPGSTTMEATRYTSS